jgi:CRP-like cAMP-binding protein
MADETFWAALRAEDRDILIASSTKHYHPAGTELLHEGESPGSAWVLMDGRVKIVAAAPGGHDAILGIRRPGDLVGEMSAIDGRSRAATVTAIDGITARRILRPTFTEILEHNSAVCHAVLKVVTLRLRMASQFRAEFTGTTVAQRLIRLLDRLVEQDGRPRADGIAIALPFSQEELASAIAASREAVVRALRVLRADGIVETTTRQQIVILRPDELRRLADEVL